MKNRLRRTGVLVSLSAFVTACGGGSEEGASRLQNVNEVNANGTLESIVFARNNLAIGYCEVSLDRRAPGNPSCIEDNFVFMLRSSYVERVAAAQDSVDPVFKESIAKNRGIAADALKKLVETQSKLYGNQRRVGEIDRANEPAIVPLREQSNQESFARDRLFGSRAVVDPERLRLEQRLAGPLSDADRLLLQSKLRGVLARLENIDDEIKESSSKIANALSKIDEIENLSGVTELRKEQRLLMTQVDSWDSLARRADQEADYATFSRTQAADSVVSRLVGTTAVTVIDEGDSTSLMLLAPFRDPALAISSPCKLSFLGGDVKGTAGSGYSTVSTRFSAQFAENSLYPGRLTFGSGNVNVSTTSSFEFNATRNVPKSWGMQPKELFNQQALTGRFPELKKIAIPARLTTDSFRVCN